MTLATADPLPGDTLPAMGKQPPREQVSAVDEI